MYSVYSVSAFWSSIELAVNCMSCDLVSLHFSLPAPCHAVSAQSALHAVMEILIFLLCIHLIICIILRFCSLDTVAIKFFQEYFWVGEDQTLKRQLFFMASRREWFSSEPEVRDWRCCQVIHKPKKSSWVPPTQIAYLVKGVDLNSSAQQKNSGLCLDILCENLHAFLSLRGSFR